MDCLVGGANFLLKAIHHEAFMYENGQTLFTPSNCERFSHALLHRSITCHFEMTRPVAVTACSARQTFESPIPCTDTSAGLQDTGCPAAL